MAEIARLEIQLAPAASLPPPGARAWNEHRGGPAILLRWLETQLGLVAEEPSFAQRVGEYAAVLDAVPGGAFAASLQADRWATAEALLRRREELRLAGWDETERPELPRLLQDMARAVRKTPVRFPDESDRLLRIDAALNHGQRLPPHRCILWDPIECWPARWRPVLARLTTTAAADPEPLGSEGTSLGSAQRLVLTGHPDSFRTDGSLRWVRSRSIHAACEAVAVACAAEGTRLADTVVCCEDPAVALVLDGCLARKGLPGLGAGLRTLSHPVLQVLPLVLRLCWELVDPALLLWFVTLPVGPIPEHAGRRLAKALGDQPGFGSRKWLETVAELTDPDRDPDYRLGAQLDAWLDVERRHWGTPLPAALLAERCRRVAQWAAGRARRLEDHPDADRVLCEALRVAAAQASALGEIIGVQGGDQSEPQLARLLEAALPQGIAVQPRPEADGGPRLVSSLAEVVDPCARLIWLGLGAGDRAVPPWTALDVQTIRRAGVDLDDGSRSLAALRRAERRGFARVSETFLAVALPHDAERRPHPVWLQVGGGLAAAKETEPVDLEAVLGGPASAALAPWPIPRDSFPVEPPQPRRALWRLPPGLLRDRSETSATELATRLACPLQWVLNYAAHLRPGDLAALPDDFRLKGSFGHDVLSAITGPDGEPLSPEEAERVAVKRFEERLPADAAPLAQPARLAERLRMRRQLAAAARILAAALRAGGYRVAGFEEEVRGQALGRELSGRIDCLARRADGEEAVIDLKYGGREKYRRFLEEGRAIQLATYALARAQAGDGRLPAVAYLILEDGLLLTPSGSPLRGVSPAQAIAGPPVGDVWRQVAEALPRADRWLTRDEPIPARPLQQPEEWPEGVALAIYDAKPSEPDKREPCRYCRYQILCGFMELT